MRKAIWIREYLALAVILVALGLLFGALSGRFLTATTFGAIANAQSNGFSYRVRDGFTPFAAQINSLRPPVSDPQTLSRNLLQQSPFYFNPQAGRAPYFMDWNFTIERAITQTSVLRTSYHGVSGVKLLSRQQTQNQLDPKYWATYGSLLGQPLSTLLASPTSSAILNANGFRLPYSGYPLNLQLQQALRPFPQYGSINSDAGGQNDGHSTFHALEASLEHRFLPTILARNPFSALRCWAGPSVAMQALATSSK